MLVAELPQSEPVMTVFGMPMTDSKRAVTIGETFKASCVSGPSYPAVNFTWIVNGIQHQVSYSPCREFFFYLFYLFYTVITFWSTRYWK